MTDSALVIKVKVEKEFMKVKLKSDWNFKLTSGYGSVWIIAYLLHKGPTSYFI